MGSKNTTKTPQIILRADLIKPEHVPSDLISTYERLINGIMPKLGCQIAIEFFDTGWIYFFAKEFDFRTFFAKPIASGEATSQQVTIVGGKDVEDDGLTWYLAFIHISPSQIESKLARVLEKYYSELGVFGEGTFIKEQSADGATRYRVERPSYAEYIKAVEYSISEFSKVIRKA